MAALESAVLAAELVCAPAGLLARGRFRCRPGDVLFAVSSSGEFRDLVEAVSVADYPPLVAVTANAGSAIGRHAVARAVAALPDGGAFTHSTAYTANVSLGLAILARVTEDAGLAWPLMACPTARRRLSRRQLSGMWPTRSAIGARG